jgi:hypothetical protein
MKNRKYKYSVISLVTALILMISFSCEREFDRMIPADFPSDGDVFIDGFSAGLAYEAFGDVKAFDVDKDVRYKGQASMRFAVPDEGQTGGFAGGRFITTTPRDLSGFDALTFWAKATRAAEIDILGFGFNAEGSKHSAALYGTKVNTNWKQYIIPIPDAAKLKRENGMFYYIEGPEEGSGYTFWIDEVKFEKLGTIAHTKPAILEGKDETNNAFNSVKIPITGLSYMANLPNGVNQNVQIAPSYFTFASSDESVATVNEEGLVTVTGEGTSVVTAKLAGEEATGSLTVESAGEFIHAPDPGIGADSVISIFSNHYENVPVDYYNGYWQPFQTTLSADFTVNGDDVLNYTNFNFVGIQFTAPTIDASDMTHLHLDIFVPNDVNPADKLGIKIVDLGANGTFDPPNSEVAYTIEGSEMVSKNWISVDISLDGLSTKATLAQIVFENLDSELSGFYVDNIYLYNAGEIVGSGPEEAAPDPTHDPANVISIYSDSYTNLEGTDYPDWGQSTVLSDIVIDGNNTLKMAGLDYQGIQLASSLDASGMEYLHIDYWSENSAALNSFLISSGPVEKANALMVPTTGWMSVDIPLSEFSPVDLADIIQMKFDGNGDIYMDNIYFYKEEGGTATEPIMAAPTPDARDAANVISVFSDAYTNIEGTNFDPDWGQATDATTVDIEGNSTLKYATFNYQGTELGSAQDGSGMEYLHIDMWTADATDVKVTPINASGSPTENLVALTPISAGQWNSYDIPLSEFTGSGMTLNEIVQLKFDGQGGVSPSNIWLDNIYFYKDGGTVATEPSEAAPNPTVEADSVISIFSDAYTNIDGTNFDPDWGQSTDATTVDVAGNSTLKYATFNYQGTVLGSTQDLSGMDYLHVDMWTADATDVKVTPINASGSPTENLVALTPISAGQWNSYDIPLSDFTASGMSLNEIVQLKFDGQGGITPSNIWLDNIYFYKNGDGGGTVSCDPGTDGELISNGGFETGDDACWVFFDNGGTAVVTDAESKDGNYSAKISTAPFKNPGIKHERFGIGIVTANQEIAVNFDSKVESLVDGAVVNVLCFSESSTEGVAAVLHNLGTINVTPGSWNSNSMTFTTAADVSGGVSLLLEVVCGGAATCSGVVYFDNVSVKVAE